MILVFFWKMQKIQVLFEKKKTSCNKAKLTIFEGRKCLKIDRKAFKFKPSHEPMNPSLV